MSVLQAIGAVPVDCIPCRSSAVGIHTPGPAARNRPHLTAHMLLPGALAGHCQRGRSPVIRDAKAGGGDGLTGKSMLAHTMVPSSSAAVVPFGIGTAVGRADGRWHPLQPAVILLIVFYMCAAAPAAPAQRAGVRPGRPTARSHVTAGSHSASVVAGTQNVDLHICPP